MECSNAKIDIIIPTHNGKNHIPRLLDSIKLQTFKNFTCFVIDDNSEDDTCSILMRLYPWVSLIEQKKNNGPAINRNIAIAAGTSKYIVIFDDDTYLEDKDWLCKAVLAMEDNPSIGQLAATIIDGFNPLFVLDCGVACFGHLFGSLFYRRPLTEIENALSHHRLSLGACTAGTIIRRDAFTKAGCFDERYFYPCEDLDLSLRIHLIGYDVIYEKSLIVYHYESQSMGKNMARKMYLYRRNCLLAIADNFPFKYVLHVFSSIIYSIIFKSIISALKHRSIKYFIAEPIDYAKTFIFLLTNLPSIIRKRRNISKIMVRPREYLLQINNLMMKL